jgi:hypothetical protein
MLWRLERKGGERLGILDTLAASTSFTNTMITRLRMRSVSLLGLLLVVLWTLLPIGGKATLRQVSVPRSPNTQHNTYQYKERATLIGSMPS